MAFAVFGPGSCYVTRTDVANATPINIGYVNEFSLDESFDAKELYGQNQYPLAYARATAKATGKMKAALMSGVALNNAFHAQTFLSGQLLMAQGESASVPGSSAFTVTVANSAHFDTDLGVIYANTGLPFQKVASGPAAGQYSVSAGVYTFAAADANASVKITYAYTSTTGGQKIIVANNPIGFTPTFQIDYVTQYNGVSGYLRVFQAVSSKLTRQFKLNDFMMPEIDFGFFANAAGNVYETSFGDLG